jgi:hypothetical protein
MLSRRFFDQRGIMQRSLMTVLAIAAIGCSSELMTSHSGGLDASRASGLPSAPLGTFVLSSLGAASAAPFATFDHVCGESKIHRQLLILGDTITLTGNGAARRATAMHWVENGVIGDSSYVATTGTWDSFDPAGSDFFNGFPALIVNGLLQTATGGFVSTQLRLRVEANGSLSTPTAMGGSCPGSANDAQHVVAVYRPI